MASTTDITTILFPGEDAPEALRAFRAGVVDALDSGVRALLVDIDVLERLDSPRIAALIVALRDARDRGAVLSLCVSRKPLLETLRLTGLDKIFTLVTPLAALTPAPGRVRRPPKRRRSVAALAGALATVVAVATGRAVAQTEPTAIEVIHNVVAQSERIHSYQATVAVDIHLRSFPYLSEHLDGTTYFKRPDNLEVRFVRVPAVAHGFDKLYTDIDDPSTWERRFDLSLVGDRVIDGHPAIVVRLVQKVRGMIDHEDVAIDPATWRIDAMEWHYYNGGVIEMSQQYTEIGGFAVLATQHATIRIPYVHAAADAVYTDYKTNVAIDDSVFTREKR